MSLRMSHLMKRFRRSGESSHGEDARRRKGKEAAQEEAPSRGRSSEKGKRRATEEVVVDNPHGIIFRNDTQRTRYNILAARHIYSSRYIDLFTMEKLGIREDVEWMLDNIGWLDFMNFQLPTYPKITLEFLSSLEVQFHGPNNEEGTICFRMFNSEYTWTLEDFNNCFRLPIGWTRKLDKHFNNVEFWRKIAISNEPYDPSRSKSTLMQNPVFKYVHRAMTKSIFARYESDGVVRKLELYCIWAMLHQVEFDTGFHFLQNLIKISKSSTGVIMVGGFISVIASSLGCNFDNLEQVYGNSSIDLDTCVAMKMIRWTDGGYAFNIHDGFAFPLPHPRTTIRNTENWILRAPVPSPSTPIYAPYTGQEPAHHEPSDHETELAPERTPMEFGGIGSAYHESSHHEPPRHSYAYGESGSAYDFSELRTSLNTLHEEHFAYQRQLNEYGTMNREQFRGVQDQLAGANEFHRRADEFFGHQYEIWDKEEQYRRSMDLTRHQVAEIYQYYQNAGYIPRPPTYPPPYGYPPPPPHPGYGGT